MIRRSQAFFILSGFCFALYGARAQGQDNSAAPQQTPAAATAQNASRSNDKPKKVWTNEDVKSAGSVSVIGDSRNRNYTMTKPADPATVAKYKADLQKLQQQLNDVNKKLQQYQDFEFGKPSAEGGQDLSHGYTRTPVDQQIAKLQDKKKQLEGQMDDLFESARKNGIDSGQLK